MAVPTILYGSESRKKSQTNKESSEMKFPKCVEYCRRFDYVRNDIRQELGVRTRRKHKWREHVMRTQSYDYKPLRSRMRYGEAGKCAYCWKDRTRSAVWC